MSMKHLKTALLTLSISLLGSFSLAPAIVGAASLPVTTVASAKTDACKGLNELDSSTSGDCSNLGTQGQGVSKIVNDVVNVLSIILGGGRIIIDKISGLRFITAAGDSNKVSSARTSLAYALIGLAVAALAQFLVHFVLNRASSAV